MRGYQLVPNFIFKQLLVNTLTNIVFHKLLIIK